MPAVLSPNGQTILDARYIDKVHDKTVEGLWDRVSMGNLNYRRLLSELLFLPNSPTLFNLGLPFGGTLSACFVFDISDSLLGEWPTGGLDQPFVNSILGTTFKAACVAKAGGGVGYYLGNIREEGAPVKSTHRKACGPVAVLHWLNRLRNLITQGGKRDLAQMAVLDAHHKDIRKFIHCKDADPQGLSSFNISVSWRDEMLKQIDWDHLERDSHFDTPTSLWYEQCTSAWKTGCPGMLFWDTINRANATPHLGFINATNPCGETPNISDEPCNLGSLAVCRYLDGIGTGARFDWPRFRDDVRTAIEFMDDILDANKFPHPDITNMALSTRKLGLGVMGWADLLALMHIPYDSNAAVDMADELMRDINVTALNHSQVLAKRKGVYPAWETAPDEVKKQFPMARNSTRTSIAPTGTIAIIADVWGSIEPHYALECTRTTGEGIKMNDGVPEWVKEKLNGFADFTPKTASEIHWKWHIKHQAAFQKHTDLGVSKTINMPKDSAIGDISNAYRMMYESGCKGGTIFRDGCRDEAVLVKKKTDGGVFRIEEKPPTPEELEVIKKAFEDQHSNAQRYLLLPKVEVRTSRQNTPDNMISYRHKFRAGGTKIYLHVGVSPTTSMPLEIFIRASLQGSTVDGLLDSWAMTFSNALQYGTPLVDLIRLHKGTRFEPAGPTGNKDIPICTSIPDYIVRYLELRFLAKKTDNGAESHRTGQLCPDCGAELFFEAGCVVCRRAGCGFSRCG